MEMTERYSYLGQNTLDSDSLPTHEITYRFSCNE